MAVSLTIVLDIRYQTKLARRPLLTQSVTTAVSFSVHNFRALNDVEFLDHYCSTIYQ